MTPVKVSTIGGQRGNDDLPRDHAHGIRGAWYIRGAFHERHTSRFQGLYEGGDKVRLRQFQRKEAVVSLLGWIILGLISGFLASKIVNKTGEGLLLDIVLGIIGAVVGGWLFNQFGHMGVTGLNLYSVLVSVAGAIVVLVLYHAIRRGR